MIVDPNGKDFPVPSSQVIAAQAQAQTFNAKLAETRLMLNMDMLASLKSPNVRHEMSFANYDAHFFTINGVLLGKKVEGAMFAGDCVLVFAKTLRDAADLARRGIRETVKSAHDWYRENKTIDASNTLLNQGTVVESGGRREGKVTQASVMQQKKLEAMMQSIYGGKPFVW